MNVEFFQIASQVTLVIKNLLANARDLRDPDSIPMSGRSLRGGHGNPRQYSWWRISMDRGDWHAIYSPQGHKDLDTTEVTQHTTCMHTQDNIVFIFYFINTVYYISLGMLNLACIPVINSTWLGHKIFFLYGCEFNFLTFS